MRSNYAFTPKQLRNAVRGKYAAHFREGVTLVPIDPDLAEVFPDADAVNHALHAVANVIRAREAARKAN